MHILLQAEELDEQNVQQTPPGFHVITLPFADDIRKTPFDKDAPRGKYFCIFVFSRLGLGENAAGK